MNLSNAVALGLIVSLGACASGGSGGGGSSATVASLKSVEARTSVSSVDGALPKADPAPVSTVQEIAINEPDVAMEDYDEPIITVDTKETSTSLVDTIIANSASTSYDSGLIRYTATVDGVDYTLDTFSDKTVALLQTEVPGGMPIYSIGENLTTVDLPEGNYFGRFDVTFTEDGLAYKSGTGEMAAYIDLERGLVLLGGTVFHSTGQISIYADAVYNDGAFHGENQSLQIRDIEGYYVRSEDATVDGVTTDTHILGTVSSINTETGFAAEGHFSAQ